MGNIFRIDNIRGTDGYGNGSFGASRGNRSHTGTDFLCAPGDDIVSPISGKVTKLGYTYTDDLSFRYVQVQNGDIEHRFFYVEPSVEIGDIIDIGDSLGVAQTLLVRYPNNMTNHIHYEIRNKNTKVYKDPEKCIE